MRQTSKTQTSFSWWVVWWEEWRETWE